MPISSSAPQKLLTAEEFLNSPQFGGRTELRRGVVVTAGPCVNPDAKDAPKVMFEFVSPENPRIQIYAKTAAYFWMGVKEVCVVDRKHRAVNLCYPDWPWELFQRDDVLAFAELPGFSVPVSKIFE